MRHIVSFCALAVLAVSVLTACNSAEKTPSASSGPVAPSIAPQAADGVRRVTVSELEGLLARNEAVVIDVRNQASYDLGHIRGSKLIPEAEVKNRTEDLPRNKLIVTYCS
jgi:3-mercaptopyruvate sulfurtransferase SseA